MTDETDSLERIFSQMELLAAQGRAEVVKLRMREGVTISLHDGHVGTSALQDEPPSRCVP